MIHMHKTPQSTARIARTACNVGVCRYFSWSESSGAVGYRPFLQLSPTYRPPGNEPFCSWFCYIKGAAVDAGDVFMNSVLCYGLEPPADPSGDVARRVLSTMVEVPDEG